MKTYTISGWEHETEDLLVKIDRFGGVTIGDVKMNCADAQIIAHLALQEEARYHAKDVVMYEALTHAANGNTLSSIEEETLEKVFEKLNFSIDKFSKMDREILKSRKEIELFSKDFIGENSCDFEKITLKIV